MITAQLAAPARKEGLPIAGLLALATAGFVTILTEALPAGLLPQIGADLAVSEAMAGQLVTLYAIGSFAAAIPLTAATRGWRRRPLLLSAIMGFALANMVTALSGSFALILAARFVAGVSAGLLWALLAGYAVRMAPAHLGGRAMALAMAGTPLALSIGIPAGTFLGGIADWRTSFGLMSMIAMTLVGWILWKLPDFAGEESGKQLPLRHVFTLPGVRPTLFVTLAFVLAHNMLYTYVAPLLTMLGLIGRTDRMLLLFGCAALASIWIVGMLIDRWLRPLTLASVGLFIVAALTILSGSGATIHGAMLAWGLGFGGAATLFQTASARAAGPAADVAQAMIVTVWNLAIAGGALIGGVILDSLGAGALPWALLLLLFPTFCLLLKDRHFGTARGLKA
ncbi:MFS transporter [Sphingomonas oleivorans]|uniref:MFS transporter n=1 Tax=Sphingomonas oleivorans TaxID=1735121 RepID=A0A2T5FZD5_9SPHN|nr:MFS transporter [Sphingomonas oleivorans]PTQ12066.1 MFS transporter [Sphingomonas oleivorans]